MVLIFFEILSPFPVFASSRYFSNPHPHFVTQKRRYTSEPIGSSRLLTIKSSLSSTSLPPIRLRSLHILYPNTHGRLAIRIITPFTNAALFLLHQNISIANDIIFSNTAITVEKLANVMNIKNRHPHTLPPVIFTNTFGSVINMRLGPAPTSTP